MKLYKYSVARGVDFSIPEEVNVIERYRSRPGRTVFIVDKEVESLEGKEDVNKEVKTIEVGEEYLKLSKKLRRKMKEKGISKEELKEALERAKGERKGKG